MLAAYSAAIYMSFPVYQRLGPGRMLVLAACTAAISMSETVCLCRRSPARLPGLLAAAMLLGSNPISSRR